MNELELGKPPGKIQAIGILHLVCGVLNLMSALGLAIYAVVMGIFTFGISLVFCCPVILLAPIGILEVISGARHLSSNHAGLRAPRITAIAELFAVLSCGVLSLVAGILTFAFLSDPEVAAYYAKAEAAK